PLAAGRERDGDAWAVETVGGGVAGPECVDGTQADERGEQVVERIRRRRRCGAPVDGPGLAAPAGREATLLELHVKRPDGGTRAPEHPMTADREETRPADGRGDQKDQHAADEYERGEDSRPAQGYPRRRRTPTTTPPTRSTSAGSTTTPARK